MIEGDVDAAYKLLEDEKNKAMQGIKLSMSRRAQLYEASVKKRYVRKKKGLSTYFSSIMERLESYYAQLYEHKMLFMDYELMDKAIEDAKKAFIERAKKAPRKYVSFAYKKAVSVLGDIDRVVAGSAYYTALAMKTNKLNIRLINSNITYFLIFGKGRMEINFSPHSVLDEFDDDLMIVMVSEYEKRKNKLDKRVCCKSKGP